MTKITALLPWESLICFQPCHHARLPPRRALPCHRLTQGRKTAALRCRNADLARPVTVRPGTYSQKITPCLCLSLTKVLPPPPSLYLSIFLFFFFFFLFNFFLIFTFSL